MLAVALALLTTGFTLAYSGVKGKNKDGTEIWRAPWTPFVTWLGGKPATEPGTDRPSGVPIGPGLDQFGNPIPGVSPGASPRSFTPAGITQPSGREFVPPGTPGRSPTV